MKLLYKIALVIIGIIAYSLLATNLLPFHFPQSTGPFDVSTQTHYLTSSRQQESHVPLQHDEPRKIVIQFWYPTLNKQHIADAPWAPDFISRLKKECFLYRFFGLDNIFTSAQLQAPLAKDQAPFPVILYSHGLGLGIRDDNTALCEELASHGYIVVGISHPYASYVVRFQDGHEVFNTINTEKLPYQERQELAAREMDIWLADSQDVIDYLEELNVKQDDNIFFKALDLDNIGALGHSFGGATAAQLCRHDARCKAGINMDGKLYGSQATAPFHKPFMFLLASESLDNSKPLSQEEIIKRYQTKENYDESCILHVQGFDELAQAIGKDVYKVIINGAGHGAFSDFALLKYHSLISRYFIDLGTGLLDSRRSHEIIKAYVCDFFDIYLKNKKPELLNNQESPYTEVSIKKWR